MLEADQIDRVCRSVTKEEIDHYQEHGWVKLKQFIDTDRIKTILSIARGIMGDDGDSNGASKEGLSYFNAEYVGGLQYPEMRELIGEVGRNVERLMNRASSPGVRYYMDIFTPKLPSSKPSKHGGNGATNFHQDFISMAVDRSGGVSCWIPLESYGPDSGTMSFVSRSHRLGVMGDYKTYGDAGIFGAYPELNELEKTEPMSYEVGDITIHSHMTIHGASSNVTDRPRWSYILLIQPADIHWTGQPCANFDPAGMVPWGPFDNERFPILR